MCDGGAFVGASRGARSAPPRQVGTRPAAASGPRTRSLVDWWFRGERWDFQETARVSRKRGCVPPRSTKAFALDPVASPCLRRTSANPGDDARPGTVASGSCIRAIGQNFGGAGDPSCRTGWQTCPTSSLVRPGLSAGRLPDSSRALRRPGTAFAFLGNEIPESGRAWAASKMVQTSLSLQAATTSGQNRAAQPGWCAHPSGAILAGSGGRFWTL